MAAASSTSSSTSGAGVESASTRLVQAIASLNQTVSATTNATLVEDLINLLERTIQDANAIVAGNMSTASSDGSQPTSSSNGSRQFRFDTPPQRWHSSDGSKSGNGGGALSTASVIGIIAAVLCAVGVIIAFLLWYRRLARKLRDQQEQEQHQQNDQASPSPHAGAEFMRVRLDSNPHAKKLDPLGKKVGKSTDKKHRHASRSSLQHQPKQGVWDDPVIVAMRLPAEDVLEDLMITKGTKSGAEIYRGTYRSSVVVIKSLSQEKKRNLLEIETLFEDAKLFRSLSLAPHARLVSMIGVSWDSLSNVRIVTEFMARGDLRSFLNTLDSNEEGQANIGFDQQKTKIALHISQALAHLHTLTPPVLYRDLTSRSVLLDENLDAKLGFFSPQPQVSSQDGAIGGLPSLWLAPEVMTGGKCDERADVYSFGIVLSELDSNALPFATSTTRATQTKQLPQMAMLNLIALGKLTVEFSPSSLETSPEIVELALRCLSLDPSARPTAAEAFAMLDQVLNSL